MLSPLATLLMAAPAAPAPSLPQDELLTVWIAEGTQLLSHSKDRALARALAMIDDRILELPGEFPEAQFPPQVVPFLVGLLTDSKTFRMRVAARSPCARSSTGISTPRKKPRHWPPA